MVAQVDVNCVRTDLVSGLERAKGKIDVLLFNPPYVPTEEDEVQLNTVHWLRRMFARTHSTCMCAT